MLRRHQLGLLSTYLIALSNDLPFDSSPIREINLSEIKNQKSKTCCRAPANGTGHILSI